MCDIRKPKCISSLLLQAMYNNHRSVYNHRSAYIYLQGKLLHSSWICSWCTQPVNQYSCEHKEQATENGYTHTHTHTHTHAHTNKHTHTFTHRPVATETLRDCTARGEAWMEGGVMVNRVSHRSKTSTSMPLPSLPATTQCHSCMSRTSTSLRVIWDCGYSSLNPTPFYLPCSSSMTDSVAV